MKKRLLTCLAVAASLLGAAEQGLLFHTDFDAYSVDAKFAAGDGKGSGLPDKDLQLRMFPGPDGKGNALVLNLGERVQYRAKGNLDPRKGTISMWIAPVNWDFGGLESLTFLNFSEKGRCIRIFKHSWGPYIIGQYQWTPPGTKKVYSRQVQMMIKPAEWGAGKWHHVAVSWDQDQMQLFIDGVLIPEPPRAGRPRFWNNKPAPPDYPVSRKPFPGPLPELGSGGWITLGNVFRSKVPETHRSAVDEIKIYDRPLSANEMRKEYERVMPPRREVAEPHLITVPRGKTPSVALMRQPMSEPTRKIHAAAKVRHDGKVFYAEFEADYPCLVRTHKADDSDLWEDDSYELHLVSPRNERFQFIINGNGAVFHTKNGDKSWNPDVKRRVELGKNSWRAILEIPLAALGSTEGEWLADFMLSQRLGSKNNYYRWSNIIFDGKFSATGKLRFLDRPDFVALRLGPELDSGKLFLESDAPKGVKVTADYVPAGQAPVVYPGALKTWKTDLPAGKLRLNVNASRGKESLFRYSMDCYVDYPLETVFNTVTKEKKIDIFLNFSNAGGEFLSKTLPAGVKVTSELRDLKGNVLSRGEETVKETKSRVSIPLPENLVKGDHLLRVTAGDFVREIDYRVPDMTPYKLRLGADETVPAPWHPVKELGKGRYAVLDRVFTFDGTSPLPVSITVKGEELFAEKPVFSFGGKPVEWRDFRVTNRAPDRICFAAEAPIGSGRLDFAGELWFDGMYKMDLALKVPEAETFFFSAAVKKEFGRYVLDPYMLEWKLDRITADVRGFNANEKRAAGLMWLTGYEKGFCFWNKSNANWVNTPGRPSFDVRRTADKVSFLARIIDKKVSLPRAARYTFVIQPTPPRTPKKNHRRFNFCSYGQCSEVTHDFGNDVVGRMPTSPVMVRPRNPEKFDAMYPGRNIKILIYTMPGHLNTWEPDMDLWDKNDRNVPGTTHSGTTLGRPWLTWQYCTNATQAPADLWTWWIDETMKRHPKCGGLYFDVATVRNCENSSHGCGGVDMFGQKYFSNDALGLREFFLRVYKVIHNRGGDIVLHCHVAFLPFVHSFIDSFAPGENTFRAACKNLWYAYTEEFSPDIYLSEFNWRKAGVPFSMILQQGRACDLMPALKQYRREIWDNPEYAIRSLTALAVYDINTWGHYVNRGVINKYWKIRRELNIDDVTDYYGYWVSDAVKSPEPKVFCGWFKWEPGKGPYRRVLIVSNFSRDPVKPKLEIDWKKLGVEPASTFRDLWNEKDLSPAELAETVLPGAHFLMLGIK
ncbi:MAG: hypothetical protein IJS01_04150 [Lentisphaeria bacterium]|nr:hypothetical protein [Lentisphaeria bacterium]